MNENRVLCGTDRLDEFSHLFKNQRIGLITNPSGVRKTLTSTVDYLREKYRLAALFAPEHGVRGDRQDGESIESYTDEKTGVPVHSIYGAQRAPKPEMLDGIDVMMYDLQDVGSRYYTFIYSMANCMQAAAQKKIPFIVLDRPNPVGGLAVEGSPLAEGCRSFIGLYPLAQRYGLTCGELALLFNREYGFGADLHVVPLQGWRRHMLWQDTGLAWVNPSPNLPNADAALLYNGTGLFEGTNVSEGRGTTRPFEMIGAPWLNGNALADELNSLHLPGVWFRPVGFTPVFHKHAGCLCKGVQVHVLNSKAVRPLTMGVHMVLAAQRRAPEQFVFTAPRHEEGEYAIDLLFGSPLLRQTLDPDTCQEEISAFTGSFSSVGKRYHLYE